ncbi:MAG: Obg family GTPase CgtA, partial [Actinomycetota bacterium]
LISVISAAKPKIADYPFSTLEPHLGVGRLHDETEFGVADLPGLIEGASEGRGLGHQFLRHVERARVLVVLVDLSPLAEHTPAEQERILLRELGDYGPELLDRPRLVIGSRADLAEPDVAFGGHRIAAVTGEGIRPLLGLMAQAVKDARELEPEPEAFDIHRPAPEGFRIERDEYGEWHVIGRQTTRAVALSDLTQVEAMDEAQRRLKALGVDKALARAGAQPGDTVHIGKLSFDYSDD